MNILYFYGNNLKRKEGKAINKLYLSNSSIQIFNTCKRRFKFKYIDRVCTDVKISSKYLSFGSSIHAALAQFNQIRAEKYRTLEILQNLLRKNWVHDGYSSTQEEKEFGVKGLRILEEYFLNPQDISKDNLIIEDMIKKDIDEKFILCGKIDKAYVRPDDYVEVLDYKTSEIISLDANPHNDIQLLLYILLFKEKLSYYPQSVSYYYLSKNIKMTHNVTEEDILIAVEFLSNIAGQIKSETLFPPTPSLYCKSNCEYFNMCDASKDLSGAIIGDLENSKLKNNFNIF